MDQNFFFVEIQKISRAILFVYIQVCYIQNLGQIESLVCPHRSFLYGKDTQIFVLLTVFFYKMCKNKAKFFKFWGRKREIISFLSMFLYLKYIEQI